MVYLENKYNEVLQRSQCVAKLKHPFRVKIMSLGFFLLDWISGGLSSSHMACIHPTYPNILHKGR